MVSMMSVLENMEMLMSGNILLIYLICFLLQQLLNRKYSVFMVVFLLASIPSTKLDNWTEFKKYRTKVQCVIFCGQTLMTDADGVSHQEVLDTHLAKILQNSSIILII